MKKPQSPESFGDTKENWGPRQLDNPSGKPAEDTTLYNSSHTFHPFICSTAPEGCLPKKIGDSECAVGSYSFICFTLTISRRVCAVFPEDCNSVLINETK